MLFRVQLPHFLISPLQEHQVWPLSLVSRCHENFLVCGSSVSTRTVQCSLPAVVPHLTHAHRRSSAAQEEMSECDRGEIIRPPAENRPAEYRFPVGSVLLYRLVLPLLPSSGWLSTLSSRFIWNQQTWIFSRGLKIQIWFQNRQIFRNSKIDDASHPVMIFLNSSITHRRRRRRVN